MGGITTAINRTSGQIKVDYRRLGIKIDLASRRHLAQFSKQQYQELLALVKRCRNLRITQIMVPPLADLATIKFAELDKEIVKQCLLNRSFGRGKIFDLNLILQRIAETQKTNYLRQRGAVMPPPIFPLIIGAATDRATLAQPATGPALISDVKVADDAQSHWGLMTARAFRFFDRTFFDDETGKHLPFRILELREPALHDELIEPLTDQISEITREAWRKNVRMPVRGYAREYVQDHFVTATRHLWIAEKRADPAGRKPDYYEIVGFSIVNRLRDAELAYDVLMYEVSMVKPEYQNMWITTYLVNLLFLNTLFGNRLKPVIIAARTPNPHAVGGLQVLGQVTPSDKLIQNPEIEPLSQHRDVFNYIGETRWPELARDDRTFVLHGANALDSGLIVPPHLIPQYTRNPLINELCSRLLRYDRYNNPLFFAANPATSEPGELHGVDMTVIINRLNSLATRPVIEPAVSQNLSPEQILNSLFESTSLVTRLSPALRGVQLKSYTRTMMEYTRTDQGRNFQDLHPDRQAARRVLVRLLLQDLFPNLPQRRADSFLLVGNMSVAAELQYQRKKLVRGISNISSAFLHKQALGAGRG